MKNFKRLSATVIALMLALVTVFSTTACKKKKKESNSESGNGAITKYYNNDNDPLVFSSQEVDKVFNPFFSSNAADSSVVGLTQIGMLTNDKQGNPAWGDKEGVVTKDLEIKDNGLEEDKGLQTTYTFVLKNNVKFSDGKPLTIKDVLFNLYVYLDPVYTGSSTIYSTDIVGLKEYRTNATSEEEQDSFISKFQTIASTRIQSLIEACEETTEMINDGDDREYMEIFNEYADMMSGYEAYKYLKEDYAKADALFKEELEKDWSNSRDSYSDFSLFDKAGKKYEGLFTTDVEMFLLNEGYITWNKKEGKLYSALANDVAVHKTWTKEQAINMVYADMIPNKMNEVVAYWATSNELFTYIVNSEMGKEFAGNENGINNISGIKFANKTAPVIVNGVTYDAPTYNADGSVKSGNEVLSITINNVDPKAIWNFSFSVSPMHYYSNAEQVEAFDFEKHFGVVKGNPDFMDKVVKNPDRIGVPVGAGPYAASKSSGGITNIKAGDFCSNNVIYFERNPYYVLGAPKIKKIRYQVVGSSQILNALYNGEIDFAEPNAKPETISELNGKADEGIENESVRTMGYGYIGINSKKVPTLEVRQAIMHTINTLECVGYYKTTAAAIHRPMSLESWAYPGNMKETGIPKPTAYYPYIAGPIPEDLDVVNPIYAEFVESKGKSAGETFTVAEQEEFIRNLVEGEYTAPTGYSENSDGVYTKTKGGAHTLKYTFTIAGEETDHPAWDAMFHAAEKLNEWGFDINVTTDANALKKLSSGDLTVWAAAWGSTIDPDMYQVYHKDSTAGSTTNWGYDAIKQNSGGKYDRELDIVEELSTIIDDARKTNDTKKRAILYADALTLVMQLAVELPTYQRDDLFAYNVLKIDQSTLTPESELSALNGLTRDLHLVSLVTEK